MKNKIQNLNIDNKKSLVGGKYEKHDKNPSLIKGIKGKREDDENFLRQS